MHDRSGSAAAEDGGAGSTSVHLYRLVDLLSGTGRGVVDACLAHGRQIAPDGG